MSRYDGLIIPRSYSEYINKTDAATLLQALQLSGVMDNAPIANSNHPVKSSGLVNSVPVNEVTSGNMHSATSNAVAGAINSSKVKSMAVFKQYNAPINTDQQITDVPTPSDLPAGSEIITYFPVSTRPIQSWAQCPVLLYVHEAHNKWIIRSLGTYSGDFEVEWIVFYI